MYAQWTRASRRCMNVSLSTVLALLLCAPGVQAQSSGRAIEEIIVTGTKRETNQQETPLAVTTLTADAIANTFINDVRAIADLTPNVLLTKQPAFNAISGGIRGTGSTSILVTQDTSVGITVDEFAISSVQSQFIELYDVEQIEVYRGPQGTLFGKNSTGGVIAITTKRPSLDEFSANVEMTYGQYDRPVGGTTDLTKLSVGLNVPLIEGKLGFRFAGVYDAYDGFYKNDKDTATFPEVIPWFEFYDPLDPDPDPLAPRACCSPDGIDGPIGMNDVPLPPGADIATTGDGRDLDGKEVYAFKAKLLWEPNDWYEALFTYEYLRDDSDSPPNVHESPVGEFFLHPLFGFPSIGESGANPYSTGITTGGTIRNLDGHTVDSDGYYLTQTFTASNFLVKLIAGYRETDETLPSTYVGEAYPLFDASRNLEREQTQIEARLVTNFDGPLNFVVGAAYFKDDVDFRAVTAQGFNMFFVGPNIETGTLLDPDGFLNMDTTWIEDPQTGVTGQDRDSYALYLDGTWEFNDRIGVSAGIRYTYDEKKFSKQANGGGICSEFTQAKHATLEDMDQPFDWQTNCVSDALSHALSRAGMTAEEYNPRRNPLPPSHYGTVENPDDDWDEVTWRVVLDYQTFEDQMLYGSVSTGFIAGGYTETCSTTLTCQAYDPETNTNYEIGYKADFLDGTLRVNTAVFYTEYEDIQRNQVVPFINASGNPAQETITVNAGKSTAYGLEVEATWLATENFTLKAGLGILEAEYDDFEFDPQPNNPDVGVVDFSDLDIPFASPLQLSIDGTYVFQLGNGGSITLNANANYQDDTETSPFDTNAAAEDPVVVRQPTNTKIEERTLVNASATWRDPDDRYYVSLYGTNLTDENKRVGANSVAFLWNFTYYGPPREYGIRIGANFH
ncbi:MAG: TonB-dependent receptor [Gammaproteobacteria bacterium]|nr:MAG: TonB-dependent receptor [Gammaproteobacteria bacterium]